MAGYLRGVDRKKADAFGTAADRVAIRHPAFAERIGIGNGRARIAAWDASARQHARSYAG